MTKYESQVYSLPITQERAFARVADLRSFEALKAVFANPAAMEQLLSMAKDKVKPDQIEQMRSTVAQMQFSKDEVVTPSKIGTVTLAIVEREQPKLVKLAAQGAPAAATIWVQLLPKGTSECALKVTIGAELNFFIRKMVEKHLKQAPDGIASMLAQMLPAIPEPTFEGADTPSASDFEEIQ